MHSHQKIEENIWVCETDLTEMNYLLYVPFTILVNFLTIVKGLFISQVTFFPGVGFLNRKPRLHVGLK